PARERRRSIDDLQRCALPIGFRIPRVEVREIVDRLAERSFEHDAIAGVREPTFVLAENLRLHAVARVKGRLALDDEGDLAGSEDRRVRPRELEPDSAIEARATSIPGDGSDVLDLDPLVVVGLESGRREVIGRMVEDLRDAERWSLTRHEHRLFEGAPLSAEKRARKEPRRTLDHDRFAGRGWRGTFELDREEQVRVRLARVEELNGEHVSARTKERGSVRDFDVLEDDRSRVAMACRRLRVPADRLGSVAGRDRLAVEPDAESVVEFRAKEQTLDLELLAALVDVEGHTEPRGAVDAEHVVADVGHDVILVARGAIEADA